MKKEEEEVEKGEDDEKVEQERGWGVEKNKAERD